MEGPRAGQRGVAGEGRRDGPASLGQGARPGSVQASLGQEVAGRVVSPALLLGPCGPAPCPWNSVAAWGSSPSKAAGQAPVLTPTTLPSGAPLLGKQEVQLSASCVPHPRQEEGALQAGFPWTASGYPAGP